MSAPTRDPRPTLEWKAHLRAVPVEPDHLVILSETTERVLQGEVFVKAALLLREGRWSQEQLSERLEADGVAPSTAWLAVAHLRALGLLADRAPDAPSDGAERSEVAYWEAAGIDPDAATRRLQSATVIVEDRGGGAPALRRALRHAGLSFAASAAAANLVVVVADDLLDARVQDAHREALASGRTWMTVKLTGTVPWLGPLFIAEQTACWACLAQRLRLNRQTERFVAQSHGAPARATTPSTAWSITLAAELAALEIVGLIAGGRHEALERGLLALDLKTNALVHHTVVRRPQCPDCGTPGVPPAPPVLSASPKRRAGDGRGEPPAVTLERLAHHVSPLTGAVRALSEWQTDGYLHVAAAQTFPMHRYDFRVLRDNALGRSGGKGFEPDQARTSALCEALERYSGIWQGEEEPIVAQTSQVELGDAAIDLNAALGFSAQQHAERDAWNASCDEPHAWVPQPFDPGRAVDWVGLWSLSHERTRYAPAAYCYYGHPDMRHAFCAADSNGCAAGGTLAEALAHALLELVERDAAAIWWYNRLRRPAVDLAAFELAELDGIEALYRARGRSFWALDLTTDVGVPVIAAISANADDPVEDITYGFGADLDPSAALAKALLEMNQSLFSVLGNGAGETRRYRTDRPTARRWFASATRANQPYLLPDPAAPPRRKDALAGPPTTDWVQDVELLVGRLAALGLETLVLDQTRADIGLPVCRAIVPGLCHFWRRLGSPRLTEQPAGAGQLTRPLAESELNPSFIYF